MKRRKKREIRINNSYKKKIKIINNDKISRKNDNENCVGNEK